MVSQQSVFVLILTTHIQIIKSSTSSSGTHRKGSESGVVEVAAVAAAVAAAIAEAEEPGTHPTFFARPNHPARS